MNQPEPYSPLHAECVATALQIVSLGQALLDGVKALPLPNHQTQAVQAMHEELMALRRDLAARKHADDGADPLLSMNGICKRFGISRHSLAAERAKRELPWIEVSAGRLMCRTSAAEAHFQPRKAAAKAA